MPEPRAGVVRSRAVSNAKVFREVAAGLRQCQDRYGSPDFGKLYDLAMKEGRRILGSFRKDVGEEGIEDIISDFLLRKLDAIVEADEPDRLFRVALRNSACSLLRRKDAQAVELGDEAAGADGRQALVRLELGEASSELGTLSIRDRDIVCAVVMGEDPDEVAAAFKTSRANVYQILSRFRRRLQKEEP